MTAKFGLFFCLALTLSACSKTQHFVDELEVPLFRADVTMVEENQELEMPPGLDRPKDRQRFVVDKRKPLRKKIRKIRVPGIAEVTPRVQHTDSAAWLVTGLPPSAAWPKLLSFWQRYGHKIEKADKKRGYILTRWQQKQSADGRKNALSRDRFVQQVRKSNNGGTKISLKHLREIKVNGKWKKQPVTETTAADMLNLLQDHLKKQRIASSQ